MMKSNQKTLRLFCAMAVMMTAFLFAPAVAQTPVMVSLPQTSGAANADLIVPVTVGELTSRGVIAYDAVVAFNAAVLQPLNPVFETADTLSAAMTVVANPNTPGRVLLSAFGSTPLSGAGTLLRLRFKIIGQAGQTTALTWQSFTFNAGNPAATTVNGSIAVSDPSSVTVSLPQLSGAANADVIVPVTVGELTSRGIIAYDAVVSFNAAVLQPLNPVFETADTLSAAMTVVANPNTPGRVLLSAFGSTALSGAGTLLRLRFKIVGQAGQATALTWQSFTFNAGNPAATPINGSITVGNTSQYEADVSPRPNGSGNGLLTVSDWIQVGRFVAGLDAAAGGEFQRADCAPKESLGDGLLNALDLAQAGRYAAGLDPVAAAGGPAAPSGNLTLDDDGPTGSLSGAMTQQTRQVRVAAASIERGQHGSVIIEFDAQGNENAFSFSLTFDPAQLRFLSASPGQDAANAALYVNTMQAASGRVGFVVGLPAGQPFAASRRQLLALNFAAAASGNSIATALSFGDQPVARELAGVSAAALPVSFSGASLTITRTAVSVSAASFIGTNLAGDAITAAFGSNLATTVEMAGGLPLPARLAGTSVKVKDSAGVERMAPLFFVAPSQINFLMPPGLAAGKATITITSGDGTISDGQAAISAVAPGLFSANASGQGIAAAAVLRVKAGGTLSYEAVSRFDSSLNRAVPVPIDLSNDAEQVFLILFGSGFRHRSALAAVTTRIGGEPAEVLYAGPQGDFARLDQINLRLPRSLTGRSEVMINLVVDGKAANPVTVTVK